MYRACGWSTSYTVVLFLRPQWVQIIAISMSVCLYICPLLTYLKNCVSPNLTKVVVHVSYGRCSVRLWWLCNRIKNTLYTSSFADDAIFARNQPGKGDASKAYTNQLTRVSTKAHPSPEPKLHLDRYNRFCRAHYCDRQTTLLGLSVAVGRIYVQVTSDSLSVYSSYDIEPPPHHNHFTAPFPGPSRWASARRELLDFMVQGKINRDRHTDHPAGRHSIPTNQCPPPPSPIFLTGQMPFLPPSQQCEITEGS